MNVRPGVPALLVTGLGVYLGWWIHGINSPVLAEPSSSSTSRGSSSGADANLAFQISGAGPASSLTVYNPANHTLYIYQHIGEGNAHVSCTYSYRIERPGGPIERSNCPVGELLP